MRFFVVVGLVTACGRIHFDPIGGGGDGAFVDGLPTIDSNIVFVTPPTLTPGAFNGLQGADAACRMFAAQANLSGTYVAYLSTSTVNAIDRLAGARGWRRRDGVPFADLPEEILSSRIWSPPIVQADGARPVSTNGDERVVTGTNSTGDATTDATCGDFTTELATVMIGSASATGWSFVDLRLPTNSCGSGQRIYCFGIDRNVPVPAPMPMTNDRRAFVSSSLWYPGGGIIDADARCQADATSAGITGTFVAFLATSSQSAASRFSAAGAPWMRVDGLRIADTATDVLTDPRRLRVPLNVTANGLYASNAQVWTGSGNPSTQGASTCSDWTATVPGQSATIGVAEFADPNWLDNSTWAGNLQTCNLSARLYCLEM